MPEARGVPAARTALITGASRGVGRSIAAGLAASGVEVALLATDRARLAEVASEIVAGGGRAVAVVADVTDDAAVSRAVGEAARLLGSIDLVVNNAGRIDAEVPLWQADAEQWRQVVEVNLMGAFHVTRAVVPAMLQASGGRIISLASGAGARDWDVASAYTASKAALIRMTGHLHEAGFSLGLRAFALAPGTVRTDMTDSMATHGDRVEFTPVERTVAMTCALAAGELDEWSGTYLRVTHDSPESLREHGAPGPSARRLGITPWGPDDPNPLEGLVPRLR